MRTPQLSVATQKHYIGSCRRFAAFPDRSPEGATTEEPGALAAHAGICAGERGDSLPYRDLTRPSGE